MKRTFTREFWILAAVWAALSLAQAAGLFRILPGAFLPLAGLAVHAAATALFWLLAIRSGWKPFALAGLAYVLLETGQALLPVLLPAGAFDSLLWRYLLNALLIPVLYAALLFAAAKGLLRLFRGREWAVFHALLVLRLLWETGLSIFSGSVWRLLPWNVALEIVGMSAVFWLYVLIRRLMPDDARPATG